MTLDDIKDRWVHLRYDVLSWRGLRHLVQFTKWHDRQQCHGSILCCQYVDEPNCNNPGAPKALRHRSGLVSFYGGRRNVAVSRAEQHLVEASKHQRSGFSESDFIDQGKHAPPALSHGGPHGAPTSVAMILDQDVVGSAYTGKADHSWVQQPPFTEGQIDRMEQRVPPLLTSSDNVAMLEAEAAEALTRSKGEPQ